MPEETPKEQNTIPVPEEPQTPAQELQTIINIEQKEKEILKKKRKFKLMATLGIIFLVLLISTPLLINYYKRKFIQNKPIVQHVEDEDKKIKIEDLTVTKKVQHNSDLLYISLEYLDKAKLTETSDQNNQIKKLEIIYAKQGELAGATPETLTEGYIFKASTFTTQLRTLEEITQVKVEAFKAGCPPTATFTKITPATVDGVEGQTFEVTNCGSDYKVTYVVKGALNYEFAQIFKGDVGYRQVYRAETEDILYSIKFYPDKKDEGPLETYKNTEYGFLFKHPKFKPDCCDITGPISEDAKKIIVLGDPATFVDKNNFDGFGVFIDEDYSGIDFNGYLDVQKKTMVDDYVIVKGEAPKLEQKLLKVGNKDGVMLKGYSWRGNDLIYVDMLSSNYKKLLVISIKNTSGKIFEKKMDEILKSFEYFEPTR